MYTYTRNPHDSHMNGEYLPDDQPHLKDDDDHLDDGDDNDMGEREDQGWCTSRSNQKSAPGAS